MRRLLIWLAVLGVLVAGGVFADNWARDYAERQVAAKLASELGASDAQVELGGTPFSLALLTRSVPSAVLTAGSASLPVGAEQLVLSDLSLTTGKVELLTGQVRAADVNGAAELSYAELSKLAKVPVSYAEGGRLALRYQVKVFNADVELAVSAKPVLDTAKASISLTDLEAAVNGNSFDVPVQQALIDTVVQPIDVGLDYGLAVTELTPADSGLSLAFGAESATLPLKF